MSFFDMKENIEKAVVHARTVFGFAKVVKGPIELVECALVFAVIWVILAFQRTLFYFEPKRIVLGLLCAIAVILISLTSKRLKILSNYNNHIRRIIVFFLKFQFVAIIVTYEYSWGTPVEAGWKRLGLEPMRASYIAIVEVVAISAFTIPIAILFALFSFRDIDEITGSMKLRLVQAVCASASFYFLCEFDKVLYLF